MSTHASRWTPALFAGLCVVLALPCPSARAQDFELNRFHPTTSARHGYITVDDGRAGLSRDVEVGLWLHYADDPLVFTFGDDIHERVVSHQLMADVVASYAIGNLLRLSVDVPVYLSQGSEFDAFGTNSLEGAGIGDVRVIPKLSLLDGRRDDEVGAALAFGVPLSVPTGDGDKLQGGPFRASPTVYFDTVFGSGLRVGANLGVTLTESAGLANLTVNERLDYGAAVAIPVHERVDVIAEFWGGLPLTDGVDSEEIQLEATGMGRVYAGDWVVGAGAGLGLLEGYGTPDFRLLANVSWAPEAAVEEPMPEPEPEPEPEPSDRDGDGYLDAEDECPDDAEDFDGWQDEDGCPDDDNDADDVADVSDECPGRDGDALVDIQEVHNGYLDDDGCPDALAELTEDRIQINGIIYFDLDSDVIQERSFPVIEDVATVLTDNPEITLVEVGGHTDSRAADAYNLDLSQRRVESVVRALEARGVDASRLVPRGYGETRLVDTGDTEEAHQRNRRVEFLILDRTDDGE